MVFALKENLCAFATLWPVFALKENFVPLRLCG